MKIIPNECKPVGTNTDHFTIHSTNVQVCQLKTYIQKDGYVDMCEDINATEFRSITECGVEGSEPR